MKTLSLSLFIAAILAMTAGMAQKSSSPYGVRQGVLHARVIATGIPGAGAVAEVGDFLRGSPMHDNALFTPYAQPGKVLDPKRVLVASTSNFGAPLARRNEPEGSVLSIDPSADPATVPAGFAAAGWPGFGAGRRGAGVCGAESGLSQQRHGAAGGYERPAVRQPAPGHLAQQRQRASVDRQRAEWLERHRNHYRARPAGLPAGGSAEHGCGGCLRGRYDEPQRRLDARLYDGGSGHGDRHQVARPHGAGSFRGWWRPTAAWCRSTC